MSEIATKLRQRLERKILRRMDCFSVLSSSRMLNFMFSTSISANRLVPFRYAKLHTSIVASAAKGPRPRYPRVWKSKPRIGTISKSTKLVDCIKGLSNVKEEIYGALDSFIAWDLEFPLITVKKALKTLENERQWKRIIQVTKWMISKGQGKTMGSYYMLLNALYEDGRLDEAEELWTKLFSEHLDSMPKKFFQKMISIYNHEEMHDKMFEIFADMEELGLRPTPMIIKMVGDVFEKLGMTDKQTKLKEKYPTPDWEYRYVKGKRVKIRRQDLRDSSRDVYYRKSNSEIGSDSTGYTENDEIDPVVIDSVEDVEEEDEDKNEGVETNDYSVIA